MRRLSMKKKHLQPDFWTTRFNLNQPSGSSAVDLRLNDERTLTVILKEHFTSY